MFNNQLVISFESRMKLPMERLIEKYSGKPFVAPSMKEVPLEDNRNIFDFYQLLKNRNFDVLVFMTGVAARTLLATLETQFLKSEIVAEISSQAQVVVRGPKPTAVCKMNNIPIAATAAEPNTWREVVSILSEKNLLQGKRIAVLEYGISNEAFLEALEERGVVVTPVSVYKWAFPDDCTPLNQALDYIIEEKASFALFTSANQVENMLQMAKERGLEQALRRGFQKTVILSIGPVTSERLNAHQLFVDFEVTPNKIDALVEKGAKASQELLEKKLSRANQCQASLKSPLSWPLPPQAQKDVADSPLMRALELKPNTQVPLWLMRQAGRYMAEYQVLRKKVDFLTLCKTPDLAAEATLTALDRLGVNAAIIFSDILMVVEPMGLGLEFHEKTGPRIPNPLRSLQSIEKLKTQGVVQNLDFVLQAIQKVRLSLSPAIPLIGFSGAPFTLASYMIEGGGSRNFIHTKTLMHSEPQAWKHLMEKLSIVLIEYLKAQIQSGCQTVQIFDSWVGQLSASQYGEFVAPYTKKVIEEVQKFAPVIYFGTHTSHLLEDMAQAGAKGLGIDAQTDLFKVSKQFPKLCLQGNLDPTLLFSKPSVFLKETEKILQNMAKRPGFIFNLGHGILPETPVEHVLALVDFIRNWEV